MLQKEFEDRIGRKVTTEEYVEANAVYMMAGELDKDEFCREWLKIGSSKLVQCLFEKAHSLDQDLQEQKLMVNECQEMISDAADAMLEILDLVIEVRDKSEGEYSAIDAIGVKLDKKITWLIGRGETIKRKARKGIAMSPEDVDYIINNLKQTIMTKVFQQEICPVYNTQGDVTAVRINYRVFGKLVKTVRRPIEKCTVVWSKTFRPRTQEPASALQQLGRAMSEI